MERKVLNDKKKKEKAITTTKTQSTNKNPIIVCFKALIRKTHKHVWTQSCLEEYT